MGKALNVEDIGIADYWRMFKAKGIRLPVTYFMETQFFDLRHGTDTHRWLPKNAYDHQPKNFDHGVLYMCSWTSEIKAVFNATNAMLGPEFQEYSFVDVGCGKGKVILCWESLLRQRGITQQLVGIDYYGPLIEVAKKNQRALGLREQDFFMQADAAEVAYERFGYKLIIYLYNPFDDSILRRVLQRLEKVDPVIVYNNPVHEHEICDAGYEVVWEKRGWHPNAQTLIMRRENT
jgi:SAM-dependent methyltransferase